VIDFSTVRCLDISCADEIVGKLLVDAGRGRRFILTGVTPSHCEAIEMVLERHQMAVVACDRGGRLHVLGPVPDEARRAFSALSSRGVAGAEEIADQLELPTETARRALQELVVRRVAECTADRYVALTAP
jgi:hypothetical protein